MEKIILRPFRDEDIALMEKWLFVPHVAKWYKHPNHWLRELHNRHDEFSFLTHFIAECEGKPIGFCQYYDTYFAKEHEVWNESHNTDKQGQIYSIDYLIGEPEYLRRGFGKQMIAQMVDRIWRLGAQKIIVEPEKENAASNRSLETNGFIRCGEIYVINNSGNG